MLAMRKLLAVILILISFFILSTKVSAQEKISSFKNDITINKDGTISITETISYDFGSQYRHGIFRNIPYLKTNSQGKKFELKFKIEKVTDEKGASYKYTISRTAGDLQIKIGDPDKTITGIHTYTIKYNVSGALTYFSDHDELYWNVTGNDWTVPIEQVSATIGLPSQVEVEKVHLACYTGGSGSTAADCTGKYEQNQAIFSVSRQFGSSEGLTIVVGFPKNIVTVLEPQEYISFWDSWFGKILKFLFFSLLVIVVIFWVVVYPIWIIIKWYIYGRDPKVGGPTTAWFDPPKTASGRPLTPAETGTLIDETAQQRDISAMIVDLARRGYLQIEERKKSDFYLHKKKEFAGDRVLQSFEKNLLTGIFGHEAEVRIKDKHLYTDVEKVKSELYDKLVEEKFFPKNPQSIRNFYILITVLALMTFNLPLFLVALIFGRAMPAKTLIGSQATNIAKSLRNFLSSQERQLTFQAKKQMMFEKLLPFAVAFGVEKIWAERFKDINLKQPDWYTGYQAGSFNSLVFTNSLNSSLSSFASAATPTSSSSGFSSGFSGGSSGGGGGGGGGGSW